MPCVKGYRLLITIHEYEYLLGLESCKHNLQSRIIWLKGTTPFIVVSLCYNLAILWNSIRKWRVTSLGRGLCEFSFFKFRRCAYSKIHQLLEHESGSAEVIPWTIDFIPSTFNESSSHVWICVHDPSQKYWRPKLIFVISSSIDTPICIKSAE